MYSTWLYYAPDRILFDCGEGISTQLTNKLFAVKKIFLTHSHADHISGLWGFLNTRSSAMGERDKPLEIYYHKSSELIRSYIDFILKTGSRLRYDLSVHEIDTDEQIMLTEGNGRRFIKAFATDHMKNEISVGYQIRETRKRLKEEFKGLEQDEIKEIIKKNGRDFITERYSHSLMTLSGDGNVIGDAYMANTSTLIHECTFLEAEDRRGDKHTEIGELLDKIKLNKPRKVILYHISNRYINKLRDTMKKVEKELKDEGIEFFYVYPGKVCRF
jgi:ribonuclease Z